MAQKMTDDQWRAFLSAGTRTGKLSTVRAYGRPHIAPIWFLLDGDDLVFNTHGTSVKGRNLAREGRASLCVDEDQPPYSFVIVEGRVELSEEPTAMLAWATRLAARYMGEDRAEEYGRRNSAPGELLVRLHIDKINALAAISD